MTNMPALTSTEAADLARSFRQAAVSIGDFRYRNWENLSYSQHREIARLHWEVLNASEEILVQSAVLVLNEAAQSIAAIKQLSVRMGKILEALSDVQKGIDIISTLAAVAGSILSGNPLSVLKAINALENTIESAT